MSIDLTKNKTFNIQNVASELITANLKEGKVYVNESPYREKYFYIDLSFKEIIGFNNISFRAQLGSEFSIQIFISDHGKRWEKLQIVHIDEKNYMHSIELPLTEAKFVRIVYFSDAGIQLDTVKIDDLAINFNEILNLKSSSSADRLWVVENLIDKRPDYGWASEPVKEIREETIEISFSNLYYLQSLSLHSINDVAHAFPSAFYIQLSVDRKIWNTVISESVNHVASGSIYDWHFTPQRAKIVRITISKPARLKNNLFQAKLLEMQMFAVAENRLGTQLKSGEVQYASELVPGAVKWAANGSESAYAAVQGDDSRLRTSTVEFPGIVQLANNNETIEGKALQSSDSRLKIATETYPGIIQLAKNREEIAGHVVQSNDERLREATSDYQGIVKLASPGDTLPGSVVQAHDPRLKDGTEDSKGIVQFAENGQEEQLKAVQSNDQRLKKGNETEFGIVKFASHGGINPLEALQSDDPRLALATTKRKGRVQLAEHEEVSADKPVQADDPRLSAATTKKSGIIRLAMHGVSSPLCAIQADDPRLSDSREPIKHEHDYAEKDHHFNSHDGTLNLDISISTEAQKPLQPPVLTELPLSVKNDAGMAAGFYGGTTSYSDKSPGLSSFSRQANGIEAYSRKKNAMLALSEDDYAVSLPFEHHGVQSSGKSIHAEGSVHFESALEISARSSIAIKVQNVQSENMIEGDLITITDSGKYTKVSKKSQHVIGVYSKEVQGLNLGEIREGMVLQVNGFVNVRCKGKAKAGELLGYSGGESGVSSVVQELSQAAAICLENKGDGAEGLVPAKLL
jgi:hypothetical protein